jgi:hypothetical protein
VENYFIIDESSSDDSLDSIENAIAEAEDEKEKEEAKTQKANKAEEPAV